MSAHVLDDAWLRAYATLALRIDRHLSTASGTALIYDGPPEWRTAVAAEEPVPPARLAEDCERLQQSIPVEGERGTYLAAQLTAMHTAAIQLTDPDVPFTEQARRCLGVPIEPVPEALFDDAHSRLAAALPPGPGSPATRLHAWQQTHAVPADRLPELARRAIAETVARTRSIVELPAEVHVDVRLDPGPHRGHYAGTATGTLYLSNAHPFNGADLLHVVAHEGFPGHIAESMLKDIHLAHRPEHRIRFMISPPFVVSEGLGLHAQEIAFPGDEAQRWLRDELGIRVDGSDLAVIHDARNALWGAWGNAALLVAEGRSEAEVAGYLARWGLLTEQESTWALALLRSPAMRAYVLGYFHGWRLLRGWLDHGDRPARVRRLLTEPLLPADLA